MNSVVQMLFHLPDVVDWILQRVDTHYEELSEAEEIADPDKESETDFCVTCSLVALHQQTQETQQGFEPYKLIRRIPQINPSIIRGRQEDAQEHWQSLQLGLLTEQATDKAITVMREGSGHLQQQVFAGSYHENLVCAACNDSHTNLAPIEALQLEIDKATTHLQAASSSSQAYSHY